MSRAEVFELQCAVQEYAWGKKGEDSAVAKLKASADSEFTINQDASYAELWMGTHPNGPSIVKIPGEKDVPLSDWVKQNPKQLGSEVKRFFKGNLPFLFKVLSVRTALSIQAHPNKEHAEQLHIDRPDMYKDPNHKPEMAIALTPFMGLCGFRPVNEVANFIEIVEEFKKAVGDKADSFVAASKTNEAAKHKEAMKDAFKSLMERDAAEIKTLLNLLVERVKRKKNAGEDISSMEGDLLLKLDSEFPGDRGCFAIYFLNVVHLEPGEAMFLEANLPHAYLSGDCMECMACSDNVVRAGLTPKYIDVQTLLEMLDYTCRPVSRTKFLGIESHGNIDITIFNPPVPDFGVSKFEVPESSTGFQLQAFESASICIIIKGDGEATSRTLKQPLKLRPGFVFFVAADTEVSIKIEGGTGMLLFRAYAGVF